MTVIALDVGTSSARAALYDHAGHAVPEGFHQVRYEPRTTADGGVEHDASVLLKAVATCLDAVGGGRAGHEVIAVGVSTFWHGLLGFDASGQPITPVYMWADTRAASEASLLRDALDDRRFHARTGCHLHSSYWPAKLRWLQRELPNESRRVARWGSFGEHLELSLFGEAGTSVSMASGTGLFDPQLLRWDREALAAAELDEEHLFPLTDRREARRGLRAPWSMRWPALRGVPWFPAVGDGVASNVGSDSTDPGRITVNVGTSAALRVITETAPTPRPGLWRYRVDRQRSIVGGATSEGGNVFAWCRQTLRLPADDTLEDALAKLLPDSHGLTVLPFLAGERAPGWRGDRRATIRGISLDTTPIELLRAALEAVALRLALIYELLAPEAHPDHVIVASGGALASSRLWTQIIADALGRPVSWVLESEATSRGAALLALEAVGALRDLRAVRQPLGETFVPDPAHHARYREAIGRQHRLDELDQRV